MKRGRDQELIRKRDEALCRRWVVLTEQERLRYDDALKVLSEQEFFISEERIMAILRKMSGQMRHIIQRGVPKVRKPRLTHRQLDLLFAD